MAWSNLAEMLRQLKGLVADYPAVASFSVVEGGIWEASGDGRQGDPRLYEGEQLFIDGNNVVVPLGLSNGVSGELNVFWLTVRGKNAGSACPGAGDPLSTTVSDAICLLDWAVQPSRLTTWIFVGAAAAAIGTGLWIAYSRRPRGSPVRARSTRKKLFGRGHYRAVA